MERYPDVDIILHAIASAITTYWFSLNREKWNFVLLTITEKCFII